MKAKNKEIIKIECKAISKQTLTTIMKIYGVHTS